MIEIYAPGAEVKFSVGKQEGIVNAVCIYAHGGVLYEIAYWLNGDRKTAWVNSQEISSEYFKQKIGFKADGKAT